MKKIIAMGIISMFLLTSLTSISAETIKKTNSNSIINTGEDIDCWAVIVGISKYYNYSDLPSPAKNANCLYNLLVQDENSKWNANNIQLLLNEKATRQNILDALDWVEENADEGDLVMVYYDGHGNRVNDENNDESDGKDETISPYDFEYLDFPSKCINYITDDELSEKFDNISKKDIKGMFLIFTSCLSGGLANWNGETSKKSLTTEEKVAVMNELKDANNYSLELTSDISADNRVILTATLPFSLAVEIPRLIGYLSFGKGVNKAIHSGKSTAEDISRYAKRWWLSRPRVLITFLVHGIILAPFFIQAFKDLGFGFVLFFPYPMWKDGYPADNPSSAKLSIIK